MRLFVLFALTFAGLVATSDDASAIGRRKRANNCCNTCGGGMAYSGGYMGAPAGGCCGGGMASTGGYGMNYAGTTVGGCCGGVSAVAGTGGVIQYGPNGTPIYGQPGTVLPAGATIPVPMTTGR